MNYGAMAQMMGGFKKRGMGNKDNMPQGSMPAGMSYGKADTWEKEGVTHPDERKAMALEAMAQSGGGQSGMLDRWAARKGWSGQGGEIKKQMVMGQFGADGDNRDFNRFSKFRSYLRG